MYLASMFHPLLGLALASIITAQDLGRYDDDVRGYGYGQDQTWKYRNRLRYNSKYSEPTHTVVCPRTLRPASVYRCHVTIMHLEHPVAVRASVQRDGVQVSSATADVEKGHPKGLLMRIPQTVSPGTYQLRVEGNTPGTVGGNVFTNTTTLHFDPRFLTMLVQTNRPVYTGSQHIRFRIILLTTEQLPYDDPVDVYILDPNGHVMRRWPSRPTNVGVVSMSYLLPFLPMEGWWRIRAVVNGQTQDKEVRVTKWYTPRFETKLYMQKYFLETAEFVTGSIEGEFGNDKGVYGNASVRLYATSDALGRWPERRWRLASTLDVAVFDGSYDFELPMADVRRVVSAGNVGSMIRVEAELHDAFMSLNQTGWAEARLINGSVNCRFVGTAPYVVVPGAPFTATLGVTYHDQEPLPEAKLADSRLTVKAEAVLKTGGRHVVLDVLVPSLSDELRELQLLGRIFKTKRNKRRYISEHNMAEDSISDYDYYTDYEGNERFLEDYNEDQQTDTEQQSYGTSGVFGRNTHTTDRNTLLRMTEQELHQRIQEIQLRNVQFAEYRSKGVFELDVSVPDDTQSMTFSVSYVDQEGSVAGATAQGIAHYSTDNEYLSVDTSTKDAKVGQFATFHIRANFMPETFTYIVMAKELMLYSAQEVFQGTSVTTLSVPVSPEMTPSFRIVVYTMGRSGEMVAGAVTVPVSGISRHNVSLSLNQDKDHSMSSVELGSFSSAGAFYGVSGARAFAYAMQAGNELSHEAVTAQLYAFENHTRSNHRLVWRHRSGLQPAEARYFVAPNYGADANRTLKFGGLLVLTDAHVGTMPGFRDSNCNETDGFFPCLIAGCFPHYERCNGHQYCSDGYDESECDVTEESEEERDFRVHHFSWFADLFDAEDGDWNWKDFNIGYKGHEWTHTPLNKVDDPYMVNAFSISAEHGFGLIPQALQFTSLPLIYITLEMPTACIRGEQVGLRVMVFNTVKRPNLIMLLLHGSQDFGFVEVGPRGDVDFFSPKVTKGDHQHLLTLQGESSAEVIFPIVATIDKGTIHVEISALSQVGRDSETGSMEILPEGARIDRHTSFLLDLKNRALVYEHLDIQIDESFEVPRALKRRFVAGSPRGHMCISGDVIGPILPDGGPTDALKGLRKRLRGTEASAYVFGANLWSLHYLRLTNQLDYALHKEIFERINVELAAIMYRFDSSGGFRMWDSSSPSVWLTSWVLRLFTQAQFQDWENLVYIQPSILSQGVKFLVAHQNKITGAFMETPQYQDTPLDQKASSYPYRSRFRGARNVTLSAGVLATLTACMSSLQGEVRPLALGAKTRVQRYLERELPTVTDPYALAVVAYALSVANSGHRDTAYARLEAIKRTQDGMVYWSRSKVDTNTRVYENNQRNLLQPKLEQEWDSHAVETTAYALLVYLIRDGVNVDQERIVQWLNAMRMHDGGFISTVDTLVTMQALTEYSYRARLRDITEMDITVEPTGESRGLRHNVSIDTAGISKSHVLGIDNVWGTVNVVGHGAGQAVMQLDVSYGVDVVELMKQPPVTAFDMSVQERFSRYGNKSMATVTICARWVNTKEAGSSGATVIEVENPTGYVAYQLDAELSAKRARDSGTFPSLRDVRAGDGDSFSAHTVWYFDSIPSNSSQCFSYHMRRWYPVANMTTVRMATIYEQYQPERFEVVMFNSSTFSLDVCEVCGSYQCPYCPMYSTASVSVVAVMGACLPLVLLMSGLFGGEVAFLWW